ncbi:Conserved_hypothetical protein [Hexamita inflata]|uniref:Uncharacterized protein n=1 Tax=Hexamita inflata TaxID=28002 RepID=A0AA86NNF2_9EUKA|nr:Conserved hypothetical protein [Hexamita inflata]
MSSYDFSSNYTATKTLDSLIIQKDAYKYIIPCENITAFTIFDKIITIISEQKALIYDAELGCLINKFEIEGYFYQFVYDSNLSYMIYKIPKPNGYKLCSVKGDNYYFAVDMTNPEFELLNGIIYSRSQNIISQSYSIFDQTISLHTLQLTKSVDFFFKYQNKLIFNTFQSYEGGVCIEDNNSYLQFKSQNYYLNHEAATPQQIRECFAANLLMLPQSIHSIKQNFTPSSEEMQNMYGQLLIKYQNVIEIQIAQYKQKYQIEAQNIIGFMQIFPKTLLLAVQNDLNVKITSLQQNSEMIEISEIQKCREVQFSFNRTKNMQYKLSDLIICAIHENSTFYSNRKQFQVNGKIKQFYVNENQISFITQNTVGFIFNQQVQYQYPSIVISSCVPIENCFLFLSVSRLDLIIYQDGEICQYSENIEKYRANHVNFQDNHVVLSGLQSFQLSTPISYLIQLFNALVHFHSREKISVILQNITVSNIYCSLFIKHLDTRSDRNQLLKQFILSFPNNSQLIIYGLDHVQDSQFLSQFLFHFQTQPAQEQLQLFCKVVQKIGRKFEHLQFKSQRSAEYFDFRFINELLFRSLSNIPLFILMMKHLNVSDYEIVKQLDLHKNQLMQIYTESDVSFIHKQALQGFSSTSLGQILLIFQIFGIKSDKIKKMEVKKEYRLQKDQINELKSMAFKKQTIEYSPVEMNNNFFVYEEKQNNPHLIENKNEQNIENENETNFKVIKQEEWDEKVEDKKLAKVKKIKIKDKEDIKKETKSKDEKTEQIMQVNLSKQDKTKPNIEQELKEEQIQQVQNEPVPLAQEETHKHVFLKVSQNTCNNSSECKEVEQNNVKEQIELVQKQQQPQANELPNNLSNMSIDYSIKSVLKSPQTKYLDKLELSNTFDSDCFDFVKHNQQYKFIVQKQYAEKIAEINRNVPIFAEKKFNSPKRIQMVVEKTYKFSPKKKLLDSSIVQKRK